MGLRDRLARRAATLLFGSYIQDQIRQATAAISVTVDDSPGWQRLAGGGPADRPWAEKYSDLEDTLEAWQKNLYCRFQ